MIKKNKSFLPDKILVYICDYDDGEPLLAVSASVDDMDAGCDGEEVGVYRLESHGKLLVKKEIV